MLSLCRLLILPVDTSHCSPAQRARVTTASIVSFFVLSVPSIRKFVERIDTGLSGAGGGPSWRALPPRRTTHTARARLLFSSLSRSFSVLPFLSFDQRRKKSVASHTLLLTRCALIESE